MQANQGMASPIRTLPRFEILTSICGSEVYDSTVPDNVLDQVPYADGPGDVKPYLARIDGTFYVLGILDVRYNDAQWTDVLPNKAVVIKVCEKAVELIRTQAPADTLVYPVDFDSWPGQCIVTVGVPLEDQSADEVKAKLSALFQGYAHISNVLTINV